MCPLLSHHVSSCLAPGAVEEISKRCNNSFKQLFVLKKGNICFVIFTTLISLGNITKKCLLISVRVYLSMKTCIIQKPVTYYYHVKYAFQSESTLYNWLNVKNPFLKAGAISNIQATATEFEPKTTQFVNEHSTTYPKWSVTG